MLILCVISWLFYDSFWFLLGAPIFGTIYLMDWLKKRCKEKERIFCLQFQEFMRTLTADLRTGYSLENALLETAKELRTLYGPEDRIRKEMEYMVHQFELNLSTDWVLRSFAARVEQEDVHSFVSVFLAAGHVGGEPIRILEQTGKILYDKLEVYREIQTITAAKQMEFRIMTVIPFGIIAYMRLAFSEFFQVLYGNLLGGLVMSGCLACYVGAWYLGRRMTEIEV